MQLFNSYYQYALIGRISQLLPIMLSYSGCSYCQRYIVVNIVSMHLGIELCMFIESDICDVTTKYPDTNEGWYKEGVSKEKCM